MLVSSASTLPSIMEEACATFNCMLAVFWNPASRGMVAKSFEIDLEQVKKEFVNYDSLNSNFIGTQWHATRGKHAECCHNISLMELLAGHLTPSLLWHPEPKPFTPRGLCANLGCVPVATRLRHCRKSRLLCFELVGPDRPGTWREGHELQRSPGCDERKGASGSRLSRLRRRISAST